MKMQGEQEASRDEVPCVQENGGVKRRAPTPEEAAYIERQAKKLRRGHALGSCVLSLTVLVLAAVGVYFWARHDAFLALSTFALALPLWIYGRYTAARRQAQPAKEIVVGEFLCSTEVVRIKRSTMYIHRVGKLQVHPWLRFWPEGQVALVEFCPLVRDGVSDEAVLVSLPGIDVPSLNFAGPPPGERRWFFFAALLSGLFALQLLTWSDVTLASLRARLDASDEPTVVAVGELADETRRFQTLRLQGGYRLVHPHQRSLLLEMTPQHWIRG